MKLPPDPPNRTYVPDSDLRIKKERVLAAIERGNIASEKVLIKAGFEVVKRMEGEKIIYFRKVMPFICP